MMRVRSRRVGFALGFVLLAASGAASCGNLIGLEEWEDPDVTPGENGGSQGGGGGSDEDTGAGGMGGAGGATTSGGAAGGGGIPEQIGGPLCQACLAGCAAEIEACENDAGCDQNYRPCIFDGGPCCKANGGAWAGPLAQAAYECLLEKCRFECNMTTHCADCLVGPLETDLDCGGDACGPCDSGKKCNWDTDCKNLECSANGICL